MAEYQTIPPSPLTPGFANARSSSPSPAGSPRLQDSGPPKLSLEFDRLSFNEASSSLGFSNALSFVKTIPSPDPSYDMMNSDTSDDGETQDEEKPGYSSKGVGSSSPGFSSQRAAENSRSPTAKDRNMVQQLDGINDRRMSRGERSYSASTSSNSPKYTNNVMGHRTGALEEKGVVYQYVAYNPNIHQQIPPSHHDYDRTLSLPSESRLFDDFDGVHCEVDLHLDYQQPENSDRPMSYANLPAPPAPPVPPPHQFTQREMVYYPAPVPAMLNLPPTLAKPRKKRDSQLIANRKSIAALPVHGAAAPSPPSANDISSDSKKQEFRRSAANLPPQLRASMFFDQPLPPVEIELKEESAVATLESILDASAKAPPVAFTEHPIAAGPAFQSPTHARTRSSVMLNRQSTASLGGHLNNRHSVANMSGQRSSIALGNEQLHHHRQASQLSLPGVAKSAEGSSTENSEQPLEFDRGRPDSQMMGAGVQYLAPHSGSPSPIPSPDPSALPTTLLAELESRKAELRSRNRTAASAFPGGMRSTLLELDAVAEVQKAQRRQKRTNLAWENPDLIQTEEPDEDVPLGLLYSGANLGNSSTRKQNHGPNPLHNDEDVPLGLIVKRELEDNEPLSKRKERLKVQSHPQPSTDIKRATMCFDTAPAQDQDNEEAESETLAARMKRLREKKAKEASGFGLGSLGLPLDSEDNKAAKKTTSHAAHEGEETLGQRRRRLQAEKDKLKRESMYLQQEVKQRNMMDIIQQQQSMPFHKRGQSHNMLGVCGGLLGAIPGVNVPHSGPGMLGMGGGAAHGGGMNGPSIASPAMGLRPRDSMYGGFGGGTYAAALQMQMSNPMQSTKQMEMVERWRSSVTGGNPG
ncbi:hypothetical protein BDZ91DRAFT_421803 [Kalaharituber pfeilii]|nr:hypothetical protein BDZ91DRAFT_421803 [Kalaharituber pfeilii]